MELLLCILLPFLGTVLGAAMVFFLKKEMGPRVQKALLGFAAGVMIAASVWSLLIPAIEMAGQRGQIPWLTPVLGFLLGVGFLLALDLVIPHLHMNTEKPEGPRARLKRSSMLMLAVTLHNLPEGMAVGVVLAGFAQGEAGVGAAGALVMAAGIALQNFPEGAVISMPLASQGLGKGRAFFYGVLSGVVEPVGAVLTLLLASLLSPALPGILAFAAGAMIYVVVEELIPEAQFGDHSNVGTIGTALGFALMMVLDIALG